MTEYYPIFRVELRSGVATVVRNLSRLVRPGGRAVLCVFGTFCLWEVLWYLRKGNAGKAFRRTRREGVDAFLRQVRPLRSYRSVGSLLRAFSPYFRLERAGAWVLLSAVIRRIAPADSPGCSGLPLRSIPSSGHARGFDHWPTTWS